MHRYIIALSAFSLFSCQPEKVVVSQQVGNGAALELYHNGSYSTKAGEDGEIVGTMTATYTRVQYQQDGEATQLTRTTVIDRSKGYHKNSMPMDLSYRVPQVILTAKDLKVESVRGNEAFIPKVVETLPIKDFFKRQLRDARYQLEFDRYDKRRYEITHLLKGEYVTLGNITTDLQKQKRLPIQQLPIDSVVTKGFRKIDSRECFEYTAYYKEREPFPYFMWEQYAYGTDSSATKYREFKADSARYQVEYSVAIEAETGLPCQEREVKKGVHFMTHPETKEQGQFESFITLENLYTKEL